MKVSLFWHRRDLRLEDNAGLYYALREHDNVLPLFIFDTGILNKLEDKNDARVTFIHHQVGLLKKQLEGLGSSMLVYYGKPEEVWLKILEKYDVEAVYTNRDYENYAKKRDTEIETILRNKNIEFNTYKDHVIFEKNEVVKNDGLPYTVFTPYSRKWKAKLTTQMVAPNENNKLKTPTSYFFQSYPNERYFDHFLPCDPQPMIKLIDMGFEPSDITYPDTDVNQGLIRNYAEKRNFPAVNGTSKLGIHFRFGTISIREKARKSQSLSETFLNELIWRDFYSQILHHFPHVEKNAFRQKYEAVEWRNNETEFEKWCNGATGFPIVDAGMRELNATGHMHNRVRMIVASFLTKHLLIDWRWGEAYFARKLLDFDLASNNGGWQWAAGCGTDAAPYFRVFNPYSQQAKFDKDFKYIKQWVPEYGTDAYPEPIVDHKLARLRCLDTYKAALQLSQK